MPLECRGSSSLRLNTRSPFSSKGISCRPATRRRPVLWISCRRAGIQLGIDALGGLALQADQHRPVGAVPLAGQGERAVEVDPDPGRARLRIHQMALLLQPRHEPLRGPHGADRVGAGGADADGEEVEDADGHAGDSISGKKKSFAAGGIPAEEARNEGGMGRCCSLWTLPQGTGPRRDILASLAVLPDLGGSQTTLQEERFLMSTTENKSPYHRVIILGSGPAGPDRRAVRRPRRPGAAGPRRQPAGRPAHHHHRRRELPRLPRGHPRTGADGPDARAGPALRRPGQVRGGDRGRPRPPPLHRPHRRGRPTAPTP